MQSAHAEGTGGTARQTTTTASAARRVRAGHTHAPCLARVRRPAVVVQARNAVLSERHARQARVVQLRRAVIRTPRRVAAHIEPSVHKHSTAQTSARRAQPHVFRNPPARANASFMRWRAHECVWPRVSTSLHVLYAVRTVSPLKHLDTHRKRHKSALSLTDAHPHSIHTRTTEIHASYGYSSLRMRERYTKRGAGKQG